MICLLFNWVNQLASVMYPANHSCLIQELGLYICRKSNVEYSLDRIEENALDLYNSAKKGSIKRQTIACVAKHALGMNINRRANKMALEDLECILDGENINVKKNSWLCKDEETICDAVFFILSTNMVQTRFFRGNHPPSIYKKIASMAYVSRI